MVSPRYCSFSSLTRRRYSYLSSWPRIYHLSLMVYGLLLLNIVLAQNYRATLKIYNGEAITLSQQNLAIFTNNNNQQINPNIQYQVMHVENGYFRRNQSSTSELSQFRQKDIEQGLIQFVHQADQEKPLIQLLYYDTTSATTTKSTLTMDVQFTMFRKNAFGAPTPLIQHEYKNGQIILQIRMYKKNLETQQRAYYNLGLSYSSSNMDGYVCTNQNILKNNFKLYQDADYYQIYQSSIPLNDFIKQSSTESAMTNGALQSFYNTIYMTYMFVTNQDVSQCYTVSFKRNFILHVGLSVSCVGSTSLTIINVCTNEKEKLQVMCEFEWPNDMDSLASSAAAFNGTYALYGNTNSLLYTLNFQYQIPYGSSSLNSGVPMMDSKTMIGLFIDDKSILPASRATLLDSSGSLGTTRMSNSIPTTTMTTTTTTSATMTTTTTTSATMTTIATAESSTSMTTESTSIPLYNTLFKDSDRLYAKVSLIDSSLSIGYNQLLIPYNAYMCCIKTLDGTMPPYNPSSTTLPQLGCTIYDPSTMYYQVRLIQDGNVLSDPLLDVKYYNATSIGGFGNNNNYGLSFKLASLSNAGGGSTITASNPSRKCFLHIESTVKAFDSLPGQGQSYDPSLQILYDLVQSSTSTRNSVQTRAQLPLNSMDVSFQTFIVQPSSTSGLSNRVNLLEENQVKNSAIDVMHVALSSSVVSFIVLMICLIVF
ncbi:hypothetical protein C9374_000138 [Naegleria lovaniensis]|uniref:Uncharacterized protein n=1 Tax=Naegleria lovaniensis TaxID=51637 RepID=A0AA88GZV4_NAELO|nr:uncharacterized protein C9374_000138 [Naegleria lovaniensis]KAG2388699.1 hypothetical protein C9374_000138 [Naegleria lovaniensis]